MSVPDHCLPFYFTESVCKNVVSALTTFLRTLFSAFISVNKRHQRTNGSSYMSELSYFIILGRKISSKLQEKSSEMTFSRILDTFALTKFLR